jgi:hypothetical protein
LSGEKKLSLAALIAGPAHAAGNTQLTSIYGPGTFAFLLLRTHSRAIDSMIQ